MTVDDPSLDAFVTVENPVASWVATADDPIPGELATAEDPPPGAAVDPGDLPDELSGYEYVGELSRGGQAASVARYRTPDGRDVVVKILPNPQHDIEQIWTLWRDLAGRGGAVPLEYSGVYFGRAYEVTPYYPLGSLADYAVGPMPVDELRQVLRHVATTLNDAHHSLSEPLVHRDLKPHNILVARADPMQVLLTDFGIAVVPQPDRAGDRRGSLFYMAPEALSPIGPQSSTDWWGLGITVAELALGRNPFDAPIPVPEKHVMLCIHNGEVPLDDIADSSVARLCQGLTVYHTEHRWGFQEIAAWLEGKTSNVWKAEATRDADRWERARRATRLAAASVSDELASGAQSAFTFLGQHYTDPVALATAIIASRRGWDEAAGLLIGERYRILERWAVGQSAELAQSLAALREQFITPREQTDRCVSELIIRLNPTSQPVFRGRVLEGDGLLAVATAASSEDATAMQDVNRLFEGESLIAFSELPGQDHLRAAADRWSELCEVAEALIESHVPPQGREFPRAHMRASILAAVLDAESADRLRREARAAATPPATNVAWFRTLARSVTSEAAAAYHAVICLAQEVASERSVDPQVRETLRPYLAEVAQRWRATGGQAAQPPGPPLLLAVSPSPLLRAYMWLPPQVLVRLVPGWGLLAVLAGIGVGSVMSVPVGIATASLIIAAGVGLAFGAAHRSRQVRLGFTGACLGTLVGAIPAGFVAWTVTIALGQELGLVAYWSCWGLAAIYGVMKGRRV